MINSLSISIDKYMVRVWVRGTSKPRKTPNARYRRGDPPDTDALFMWYSHRFPRRQVREWRVVCWIRTKSKPPQQVVQLTRMDSQYGPTQRATFNEALEDFLAHARFLVSSQTDVSVSKGE